MNNKILFFLMITSTSLIANYNQEGRHHSSYGGRGPELTLSSLAYLFEHSDSVLVITNEKSYNTRSIVDSILVVKKDLNIKKGEVIYIDPSRNHNHIPPLIFSSNQSLLFLKYIDVISPNTEEIFYINDELVLGSSIDKKFKQFSVVAGTHGVIPLINLDELADHSLVIAMRRINPNATPLQSIKRQLKADFDTDDGLEILQAVEAVIDLYQQPTMEGRIDVLVEGLSSGNPATIKLMREFLAEAKFLEFEIFNLQAEETNTTKQE